MPQTTHVRFRMNIPAKVREILERNAAGLATSQYARAVLDEEAPRIRGFIAGELSGLAVLNQYAGGNTLLKHPPTETLDFVLPRELNVLYKGLGRRTGFGRSGLIRLILADHCSQNSDLEASITP